EMSRGLAGSAERQQLRHLWCERYSRRHGARPERFRHFRWIRRGEHPCDCIRGGRRAPRSLRGRFRPREPRQSARPREPGVPGSGSDPRLARTTRGRATAYRCRPPRTSEPRSHEDDIWLTEPVLLPVIACVTSDFAVAEAAIFTKPRSNANWIVPMLLQPR